MTHDTAHISSQRVASEHAQTMPKVGAHAVVPGASMSLRLANKYVERLQTAAECDLAVAEQFTKVISLVDRPLGCRNLTSSPALRPPTCRPSPTQRRPSSIL